MLWPGGHRQPLVEAPSSQPRDVPIRFAQGIDPAQTRVVGQGAGGENGDRALRIDVVRQFHARLHREPVAINHVGRGLHPELIQERLIGGPEGPRRTRQAQAQDERAPLGGAPPSEIMGIPLVLGVALMAPYRTDTMASSNRQK